MKIIEEKSVSCVKGIQAAGCAVGLKKSGKKDMGLIFSEVPAVCAGVFTKNVVKAAPVLVDMEKVKYPVTRAFIINSGNANACTGEQGVADAHAMAQHTAECLGVAPEEVMCFPPASSASRCLWTPFSAVSISVQRLSLLKAMRFIRRS